MHERFIGRTDELRRRMAEAGVDGALLTDPDSIHYLAGYWGYLGMEFGRPTMVLVGTEGACTLITPLMEAEMARAMTWIEDVRPWEDGVGGEWAAPLGQCLSNRAGYTLAIERARLPAPIAGFLGAEFAQASFVDADDLLGEMRMIKDAGEIAIMRHAGQVAVAMAEAAKGAIAEGVPEYEIALAVIAGGTRKAAEFLAEGEADRFVSPAIHNLQILQSGHDTSMVHRRSSVRRLREGDPVYLCFCGIANFKHYKLGFDREFFLGHVTDEQARLYETAVRAQAAALAVLRPGVAACDVHAAAEAVYSEAGVAPGYRTGRAIGCSYLERPELKAGDTTKLLPGMAFAVDGGITIAGRFGARVGDSVVVTEQGHEVLTPYPNELCVI